VTDIIATIVVSFATPKATAKLQLLLKLAYEDSFAGSLNI
jgi:hypothetical protein